jgi:hypothetical protein
MTTRLTVNTVAESPYTDSLAPLATLPESLRRAGGPADLAGIQGVAGWTGAAAEAIRSGARGVLVTEPAAEDTAELETLAGERRVPVVIDSLWAGNPAVDSGAAGFARLADGDALLEGRVDLPVGSDLGQAALDLLTLVRRAVAPVADFRFVRRDPAGFDALATLTTGAGAALAVILSDALPVRAALRIVGPRDAVELLVPAPATAAPGRAVVSGPGGETLLETRYESAARASWRRLHRLVLSGEVPEDLAAFAADVRVLRSAPPC